MENNEMVMPSIKIEIDEKGQIRAEIKGQEMSVITALTYLWVKEPEIYRLISKSVMLYMANKEEIDKLSTDITKAAEEFNKSGGENNIETLMKMVQENRKKRGEA